MSIDKDIHQSKFRNEYQKATINIIYSCNWLQEKMKRFLEPADITLQQYNILRILRGESPLSTLQIRERMLDKMSDTSRLVDRLVKKGLLQKKPSRADKRLVDVTIRESGLSLLASLDMEVNHLDKVMASLSIEEAMVLSNLLDKMRGG